MISGATAYLKEDRTESQLEVIKVATQAKKLRDDVDKAMKDLNAYFRTELSLLGIIEAYSKMNVVMIQLED